ncbi:MAG: YscO family type III secretion system apparatus protein [Chromatiales bacterium]|nr:YscO family type III secretion system apparatus protein [Chromatiales bacterium]
MLLLIDELLRVKRIREDAAIQAMNEKQLQLEQCRKDLERKVIKHDHYIEWRKAEEQRLYAEVLNKTVHAYNLNTMRDQITSFQEKQQKLKEEIEQAEAAVTDANERLAEAKEARMDAYKTTQKYEEYKNIIATTENKEKERREELEAEEFNLHTVHRP